VVVRLKKMKVGDSVKVPNIKEAKTLQMAFYNRGIKASMRQIGMGKTYRVWRLYKTKRKSKSQQTSLNV